MFKLNILSEGKKPSFMKHYPHDKRVSLREILKISIFLEGNLPNFHIFPQEYLKKSLGCSNSALWVRAKNLILGNISLRAEERVLSIRGFVPPQRSPKSLFFPIGILEKVLRLFKLHFEWGKTSPQEAVPLWQNSLNLCQYTSKCPVFFHLNNWQNPQAFSKAAFWARKKPCHRKRLPHDEKDSSSQEVVCFPLAIPPNLCYFPTGILEKSSSFSNPAFSLREKPWEKQQLPHGRRESFPRIFSQACGISPLFFCSL